MKTWLTQSQLITKNASKERPHWTLSYQGDIFLVTSYMWWQSPHPCNTMNSNLRMKACLWWDIVHPHAIMVLTPLHWSWGPTEYFVSLLQNFPFSHIIFLLHCYCFPLCLRDILQSRFLWYTFISMWTRSLLFPLTSTNRKWLETDIHLGALNSYCIEKKALPWETDAVVNKMRP